MSRGRFRASSRTENAARASRDHGKRRTHTRYMNVSFPVGNRGTAAKKEKNPTHTTAEKKWGDSLPIALFVYHGDVTAANASCRLSHSFELCSPLLVTLSIYVGSKKDRPRLTASPPPPGQEVSWQSELSPKEGRRR